MPTKKIKKRNVKRKPVIKAKNVVVKKSRAVSKKVVAPKRVARRVPAKNKLKIVVKNLVLFGILFVLSVVIASISSNELVDQLFWILAIITAFVAVAFLIVLLILVFMKQIRK